MADHLYLVCRYSRSYIADNMPLDLGNSPVRFEYEFAKTSSHTTQIALSYYFDSASSLGVQSMTSHVEKQHLILGVR